MNIVFASSIWIMASAITACPVLVDSNTSKTVLTIEQENFDPADYPSLRETFTYQGSWNQTRPANFYELIDSKAAVCKTLLDALNEPYFADKEYRSGKRRSAYLTNEYSVPWQKIRPLKSGQRYASLEHEFAEIDLNNDGQIEWVVNYVGQMHNLVSELLVWVNSNPRLVYEKIHSDKNASLPRDFTRFLFDEKEGYVITGWRAWRRLQGKDFKLAKNIIEPRCSTGDCRSMHKKFDKPSITYPTYPASKYDLVTVEGKSYFTRVFYSFYEKPRNVKSQSSETKDTSLQHSPPQYVQLYVSLLHEPQVGEQICEMRSKQKYIQMEEL